MMRLPLFATSASHDRRGRLAWALLRLTLAGLIAAHGWARLLAGGVPPFGTFLTSQGLPFGPELAMAVTALEIVGSIVLAAGRFVAPLCIAFSLVYVTGIVLVHAKAGWFVVGLGRNGAEYSVLLIVCLLCVALQHTKPRGEP
jgi:putative oxidoreductase